jgi:hypothetical protein
MPRIDDYLAARKLAQETLASEPFEQVRSRSGFEANRDGSLRIPFLNRLYRLSHPDFGFQDDSGSGKEIPLQEQIIILHYLMADWRGAPAGAWIAYREIPGAAFYFGAFVKRAIEPLKKAFGRDAAGFGRAAARLEGRPVEPGDAAFEFAVLPHVPLRLILYTGDEEFPPEANILFDRSVGGRLSPEDAAWLAGMLVYRLIALSR